MNNNGLYEIPLFPIPGSVSFPQTVVPLHVFEPRYRQMIEDCVEKNLLLGVCHTKSIERFAMRQEKPIQSKVELYQMYQQNLTTFSPEEIFSAGLVDIQQKTEDGRYMITIYMLKRFKLVDLVQNDPYKIGLCEEYSDFEEIPFEKADETAKQQKSLIIDFIKEQYQKQGLHNNQELVDLTNTATVNEFTFKMFRFYRMQEIEMQEMLNSRDPLERLLKLSHFTEELKSKSS